MKTLRNLFAGCATGLLLLAALPVHADDSEVFTSAAFTNGGTARPNILFIIDTSGSMDTVVDVYNPNTNYAGSCPNNRVYWGTDNTEEPPSCTSTKWIAANKNTCADTAAKFNSDGWWRGRAQQFQGSGGVNQWQNARSGDNSSEIECGNDSGKDGPNAGSPNKWATNSSAKWTSNSNQSISWNGKQSLSLYTSNYINWWNAKGSGLVLTRLQIVTQVAKQLIDQLNGVNLGLMRYSANGGSGDAQAEGGMVTYPVSELTPSSRTAMKALLDSYVAAGFTPLQETYYEAQQYMAGKAVDYGVNSKLNSNTPFPSVAASRVGGVAGAANYDSPMDWSCQNNFIVYLTDGLPTQDANGEAKIKALPNFANVGGSCSLVNPSSGSSTSGRCMADLARYLNAKDQRSDVTGNQTIKTYMIGFGSDVASSKGYLDSVAAAGGTGSAYAADSVGGLVNALEEIFGQIQEGQDVTFTSPTLSVNAFNRTRNLNDLYVSVFSPSRGLHWPGNLKKYQILNGKIVDARVPPMPAVDPGTGFFEKDSRSFWSQDVTGADIADGPEVTLGGASSQIPNYAEGGTTNRNLYTYLGNTLLSDPSNAIVTTNTTGITDARLGTGASPTRDAVIAFARGQDLTDEDKDTVLTERRMRMGDPMHARPALVIYSGTADAPVGVVYVPTNDGYLHAVDSVTGRELWSFVPPEFLGKLAQLYTNAATAQRVYALDGDITVFKYDVNGNGTIDTGDKVWLVFGFARGGGIYYALDVTDKTAPKFMWKLDSTQLPGIGKAWSPAQIAQVNISGATQNPGKFVLIFGGGYDDSQDIAFNTADAVGNRIFMVDLEYGTRLWYAGDSASSADLKLAAMKNAIPSRVAVMDLDGDKYADRLYVGDVGGRLWRFDIWNGNPVGTLVTGGVIAKLGAGDNSPATLADTRRFFSAPDVALIQRRGAAPFFNLALGSGFRGHPLEVDTQDRFYSLRDYLPFTKRTQAAYDALTPTLDSNLVDITGIVSPTVPNGSPGWKLQMKATGSWAGEKVLAESVTVAGVILFPSFTPLAPDPTSPCTATSLNRSYAIRVENGEAYFDSNKDGAMTTADRSTELKQAGIAAEISVLINANTADYNGGAGVAGPGGGGTGTTCVSGVEVLRNCVDFGSTVRSFWQHQ